MTQGSISVDTSRWPIVVHTVLGAPSNAAVDEYIQRASEVLEKRKAHVTILDARRTQVAPAYTRQRARAWIRENRDALAAHCLGTVYVIDSSLLRFVLMKTLLFVRLPTPYHVCEGLDEAIVWARQRLANGGR